MSRNTLRRSPAAAWLLAWALVVLVPSLAPAQVTYTDAVSPAVTFVVPESDVVFGDASSREATIFIPEPLVTYLDGTSRELTFYVPEPPVTLTDASEVFPLFQHVGVEFIYILAGEVLYRHGRKTYHLKPGDSLFFDSEAAHGPEELVSLPVKMIAVLSRARDTD